MEICPLCKEETHKEAGDARQESRSKIIMLFVIINMALSVIIMYLIGWQIHQRSFPFRSWKDGGPKTGWDWINLVFIVYNLYVIITTWMSLGFSLYGVLYLLIMLVALFAVLTVNRFHI